MHAVLTNTRPLQARVQVLRGVCCTQMSLQNSSESDLRVFCAHCVRGLTAYGGGREAIRRGRAPALPVTSHKRPALGVSQGPTDKPNAVVRHLDLKVG